MSGWRLEGPQCVTSQEQSWLDRGTLARMLSPAPSGGPPRERWLWVTPAAPFCPQNPPDVSALFSMCTAPERGLTAEDFEGAARKLSIEAAVVQAIAEVETPRGAFDDCGRPVILYERHYFHSLTGGRYDRTHSDLSNAHSGGYGSFRAQYDKLKRAMDLDAHAALQSVSMGRFQIMGKYYADLGYSSPQHMMRMMMQSEREHLKAFVGYALIDPALLKAMRNKSWRVIARRYNGPDYERNNYHTRLEAAYERFRPARQAPPAPATPPAAPPRTP